MMEEKSRVIAILADEFINNRPLAEKLREDGFRVEVINHQQATCDSLASINPDIIITDADTGNTANPFHLIAKIKGDERLKGADVFFYSASIDVKTEISLRKLKVNSFFTKSDNVGYMVDAVKNHFDEIYAPLPSQYVEEVQDFDDQEAEAVLNVRSPEPKARKVETTDEFTNMFADLVDDVGEDQKKDENQFEASYNTGVSLYDKELYGQAIENFEKSAQSPVWRLKSLLMTGMAQKKMGDLDKAVNTFKAGYRDCVDESGKAEFLYELGDTLDATGRMEEAYKMFAAVYQRNKEFRDVRARLVSLKSAIEIRNKA